MLGPGVVRCSGWFMAGWVAILMGCVESPSDSGSSSAPTPDAYAAESSSGPVSSDVSPPSGSASSAASSGSSVDAQKKYTGGPRSLNLTFMDWETNVRPGNLAVEVLLIDPGASAEKKIANGMTNSSGAFNFTYSPEYLDHKLRVRISDWRYGTRSWFVTDGLNRQDFLFTMSRYSKTMVVTVQNSNGGAKVPSASVQIRTTSGDVLAQGKTSGNGLAFLQFRPSSPQMPLEIRVTHPEYLDHLESRQMVSVDRESFSIAISKKPYVPPVVTIDVFVKSNVSQNALQDCFVRGATVMTSNDIDQFINMFNSPGNAGMRVWGNTDSLGHIRFTLETVFIHTITLAATCDGFVSSLKVWQTIPPGTKLSHTFYLKPQ